MQVRVLLVLARNTCEKPERYLHLLLPLEPRCSFWIYRKLQSMHHKCRPMCSNHRFYFDISAFHSVKKFRFFYTYADGYHFLFIHVASETKSTVSQTRSRELETQTPTTLSTEAPIGSTKRSKPNRDSPRF